MEKLNRYGRKLGSGEMVEPSLINFNVSRETKERFALLAQRHGMTVSKALRLYCEMAVQNDDLFPKQERSATP